MSACDVASPGWVLAKKMGSRADVVPTRGLVLGIEMEYIFILIKRGGGAEWEFFPMSDVSFYVGEALLEFLAF